MTTLGGLLVTASTSSSEKSISNQPSISSSGGGESSTNRSTGLILTNSNKMSSGNMTSFDHSKGSVSESTPVASLQNSEVLSEVPNHTYTLDNAITMTDNVNDKGLKVIANTDSTSAASSNLVPDQSSNRKNDKKVYLSGKTLVEEIISDDDTYPEQCHSNHTLWITFDRHVLQMTDKTVLEQEELSD